MQIFEFTVKGPPVGVNAKEHSRTTRRKYREWITKVAEAARGKCEPNWSPTEHDKVVVTISNYHAAGYHDVDNIIKPICDALNKIVYVDDKQVYKVISERIDISQRVTILDPSAILTQALEDYPEFVHVVVSWEEE